MLIIESLSFDWFMEKVEKKIGNESKDAAVPHGAFRYIGYNECVHTYRIR